MRWHLVTPAGQSLRTCEAASLAEARYRLRPIPPSCFVASDAAHQQGYKRAGCVTPGARVARRTSQARRDSQARYRAKKAAAEANYHYRRRYVARIATAARLTAEAAVIIGKLAEGWSERAVARHFDVSQQAIANLRGHYNVPSPREMRRRRHAVLVHYYATQGHSKLEIAHRTGLAPKTVRRLIRAVVAS